MSYLFFGIYLSLYIKNHNIKIYILKFITKYFFYYFFTEIYESNWTYL